MTMALPAVELYILGAVSALLAASGVLFLLSLRRSFEMLRARLFLQYYLYEKFFIAMGATVLGLTALDLYGAIRAPEALRPVPDIPVRAVVYGCAILLFVAFHRSIRGKREGGVGGP